MQNWKANLKPLLFLLLLFAAGLPQPAALFAQEDAPPADESADRQKNLKSLRQRILYSHANDRVAAIQKVVKLKETAEREAFVDLFIQLARDDLDWDIRRATLKALADMKVKRAEPVLLEALKDKRLDVRRAAVEGLGKIGGAAAFGPLAEFIRKQDFKQYDQLLTVAIRTLGRLKYKELAQFLKEKAKDDATNNEVRLSIIRYFGLSGNKDQFDYLLQLAQDEDSDLDSRAAAIDSLGTLGAAEAVKPLQEILAELRSIQSAKERTRLSTLKNRLLRTLIRLGDKSVYPDILAAARDNDPKIRLRAVRRIGTLGMRDASDLLEYKAEHDTNAGVRKAAKKALEQLNQGTVMQDEEQNEEDDEQETTEP